MLKSKYFRITNKLKFPTCTAASVNSVVVLQVEPAAHEKPVVSLIGYDGNITQRILGESSVHLNGVRLRHYSVFAI